MGGSEYVRVPQWPWALPQYRSMLFVTSKGDAFVCARKYPHRCKLRTSGTLTIMQKTTIPRLGLQLLSHSPDLRWIQHGGELPNEYIIAAISSEGSVIFDMLPSLL